MANTERRRPYREVLERIRSGKPSDLTTTDLPTPCLIVDLDRFEENIQRMARFAKERGVALRPHAKTHKCPDIARRQIAAGAVGVCAATIAEAEVLSRAGVRGLLITGEMVGPTKIDRLIDVVRHSPDTMVVADHPANVIDLAAAAAREHVTLQVLVDLDIGTRRTGAEPGQPAVQLAEAITKSSHLKLRGICAYAGHAAHILGFEERKAHSRECWEKALATRDLFLRHGFPVELLTGASTGTYNIDSEIAGVNELQSGSYIFMDVDYRRIGGRSGPLYEDFAPALFLLATVIHRSGNKAVVDAGLKAMSTDRPFGPEVFGVDGVEHQFAGDEHSRLLLDHASRDLTLGEQVRFIVPHCDPTVNLYDRLYACRGERVEEVWSIMDRALGSPFF